MTASIAYSGIGSTLSIGATPVVINGLKTASFSGSKNDTVDITNFGSPGRAHEFLTTLLAAGNVKIAGNVVPADPGQVACRAAFNSGVTVAFALQTPLATEASQTEHGDSYTFSGIVEEFDVDVAFDKEVSFSGSIKISGEVTYTAGS